MSSGCLAGLRIIDLTSRRGGYCGHLLADLGADVVLVEPPEGDVLRRDGPFFKSKPDSDESVSFSAYHGNKRGTVLDLKAASDRRTLLRLVRGADVLLYDRHPRHLEEVGLGESVLRKANPGLITCSITPFGETGPYSRFKAPNIVTLAMSGLMGTAGFPGRAPLAGPADAAHKMACVHAAFGILVALLNRPESGGQHVEVSEQEVLAADPFRRMILDFSVRGELVRRDGTVSAELFAGSYPTADGYINLYIQVPSHWHRFVQWLGSPEELSDPALEKQEVQKEHRATIDRLTIAKTSQLGKAELTCALQELHLAAGAVNTPAEFLAADQTKHRGFVGSVRHSRLGEIKYPGDPYVLSRTPYELRKAGPLLDEHRDEVLKLARRPSPWLRAPSRAGTGRAGGLEGVRVVTFPTGVVGPCIGRLLGDHGAEVIAIEAREKPTDGPAKVSAWTLAQMESNRSRKRISLNMSLPEARDIARQLIEKADVVTENFSARVMRSWGFDYENVRKINPEIVMISLQSFGNSGPRGSWISYGSTLLALSGYSYLWQDPGRPEMGVGCNTYFPDYVAPSYGALAVMAALNHRARTGEGQYIDLSQEETAAALMTTELLEQLSAKRTPEPMGNASTYMAPHGCYRCRGEDRWCVIAVADDDEWHAFCGATEHPEWEHEPRFATLQSRLDHRQELDELIESWTCQRTPHQVMVQLQHAGVAAGVVADSEDLYRDPHLRARGFAVDVPNETFGWITQVDRTARLSATPGPRLKQAPAIGADNEEVLKGLLGFSSKKMKALAEQGVFG